jgi:hypothetical protein
MILSNWGFGMVFYFLIDFLGWFFGAFCGWFGDGFRAKFFLLLMTETDWK